ncbi:hypothetical protein BSKO_00945 [Bryopsis sp. KO-2023]|nr:hypothetical protein BSKO_00945 [Bryopsis sp. KO-2023]
MSCTSFQNVGRASFQKKHTEMRSPSLDYDSLLAECDAEREAVAPNAARRGASSVEVYGFVGWVTSGVAYFLYLLWAFIPDSILESVGITYFPDKHWALSIPMWMCMVVVYVFVGYECLCKVSVPPPSSRLILEDDRTPQWTEAEVATWSRGTGPVLPLKDIPPALVSKLTFAR